MENIFTAFRTDILMQIRFFKGTAATLAERGEVTGQVMPAGDTDSIIDTRPVFQLNLAGKADFRKSQLH